MNRGQTVSDTKRAFHRAYDRLIAPAYRHVVDELLVELNLLSNQRNFHADPIFCTGLCQVFDSFMAGYRPTAHLPVLFAAITAATGLDGEDVRRLSNEARNATAGQSSELVKVWVASASGAPAVLAEALEAAKTESFHYSRLFAVGLITLIESAEGVDTDDAEAAAKAAKELTTAMGLAGERVDKDLSLYRSNLEKMAMSLEVMEEAVAAERRKRERQEAEARGTGADGDSVGSAEQGED
ncbi:MAG: photosystem II biogenesis protein Psp29 [Aphanocapsa feldmannii 277cV]|uniref:Protein Thf1 n=1 Tax=Aphanocapsa feldmannii 277cV TaxID=2507553 RepID=A0A524RL05_9CHRO|nr:MAG: photosystem II biogenesis protein Psp29 [Aphanocapsa feldmannii 288cV]TGG90536.1 MAG: photosystem II biogenesis protein Psp29 [Aphanocapsa feldmannii 277cV]